jgi:ion channel
VFVPSIAALLHAIPDEFKPLAALGVGSVILVILVIFHGISLHKILIHFKRRELRLESGRPHLWGAAFLFGWAIFMMLSLHVVEIIVWGLALLRLGLVVKAADAIYFCANAYTTMGYGTVDLSYQWRNITPVIAISGLFTFAWTTSSLVTMVQSYMKIVEQLELERAKQLGMRSRARHESWQAVDKERQAEKDERIATRKAAAGAGFWERRKIWREEHLREEQLREAARDEVAQLRKQESEEEDKLGEDLPLDDAGVQK